MARNPINPEKRAMNFSTRYEQSLRRVASLSPAVRATITDRAARLRLKQMKAGIRTAHTIRNTQP